MGKTKETSKKKGKAKWIIGIAIVVVIIAAISGGNKKDQTGDTTTPAITEKGTTKETEKKTTKETEKETEKETTEENEDSKVTMENFLKISANMTYEQVVEILGEGEQQSESEIAGSISKIYVWNGEGFLNTITVTFTDSVISSKSQTGLGDSEAKITKEKFDAIQTGMTYDQVKEIVGGAGDLSSVIYLLGTVTENYDWNGEKALSNASISIQDGVVSSKSQYGLE